MQPADLIALVDDAEFRFGAPSFEEQQPPLVHGGAIVGMAAIAPAMHWTQIGGLEGEDLLEPFAHPLYLEPATAYRDQLLDEARRERRHSAVTIFARLEFALRALARVDVDRGSGHLGGNAVRVVLDNTAAIEHPLPVARRDAQSVLEFIGGCAAGEMRVECRYHRRLVVRVHTPAPRILLLLPRATRVARHRKPVLAQHARVTHEIPVPIGDARAPERGAETRLRLAQGQFQCACAR